jgi:trigger factor
MSEFNTLTEWKDSIKAELMAKAETQNRIQQEGALIDKIVETSQVEAPEAMVEEQIDAFIKDFEYRLMYQGLKLDDYLNMMGTKKEDLRKERREDAIKTVKTRLVLEQIIKQEKIEVSKEDFDEKMKELSTKANKTLKEFEKGLNENQLQHIANDIIVTKLLDFLKANNNI